MALVEKSMLQFLQIGGVSITSDAAELIIDGSSAGTVANGKAVIYSSSDGNIAVNTSLVDTNGRALIKFTSNVSARNELTLANAETGSNIHLEATGLDTDIGINIIPKGIGNVNIYTQSSNGGALLFYDMQGDEDGYYTGITAGSLSKSTTFISQLLMVRMDNI